MEERGELPDCSSNCPLDDEEFSPEAEEGICNDCFLNSKEYEELSERCELFEIAMGYLQARDVGLEEPADNYTSKEQQAILIVHQEIERWKNRKYKDEQKKRERKEGVNKYGQD